jgi:hypothetical protein
MSKLKYLAGYSATITDQVYKLIDNDKLAELLLKKYPVAHNIRTDKALYAYAVDMKNQFLRQSSPVRSAKWFTMTKSMCCIKRWDYIPLYPECRAAT